MAEPQCQNKTNVVAVKNFSHILTLTEDTDSALKVEKSLPLQFMIAYKTQQINSNLCFF